jgi:hypothetical protein
MLTELHKDFLGRFGGEAATAKEGALSKRAKNLMTTTCKKYEDSSTIDKAQVVLNKVDGVKAQMQDNIAGMLKNTEKAESLAEQSDQLNEQASVFKKSSEDLKKRMKCKNLKMTLLLGGLVVGILIVIIFSLVVKNKNSR